RLLEHEEWAVRLNAVSAAATQADPALTPLLDRQYVWVNQEFPEGAEQSRLEIVGAAASCGGDHLPVVLNRALADRSPSVRLYACDLVAGRRADSLLR